MISTYLSWTAFKGRTRLQLRAHVGALSTFLNCLASTLAIYFPQPCNIAGDSFVFGSTLVVLVVLGAEHVVFIIFT